MWNSFFTYLSDLTEMNITETQPYKVSNLPTKDKTVTLVIFKQYNIQLL